jgi:hypothetical protein
LTRELNEEYGATVSFNEKTGEIVFESKECGVKKTVSPSGKAFDLAREIELFTDGLDVIILERLEKLDELKQLASSVTIVEGKETLYFGEVKAGIKYFGNGHPTLDSLLNADAASKRSIEPRTAATPLPVEVTPAAPTPATASPLEVLDALKATLIPTQTEIPTPVAAAATVVEEIFTPRHEDSEFVTTIRHITDGKLPSEVIEGKARMWAVLQKINPIENSGDPIEDRRTFITETAKKLAMTEDAFRAFFDPEVTNPPIRRAKEAMDGMEDRVINFVREAKHKGEVPHGTIGQFRADLKALKAQIETRKEQWERE